MPDQPPTAYDVTLCVENLRAALALHGTLPSLRADLASFANARPTGLVALGNCNTATAHALATALQKSAGER
ncbi:hypothetical protein [Streptomyces sp. NPDC001480]|uniref:hypothetical protein n=1 Tax=Streptomyces sp. NPDC001480 TaxID=3364577 RepID=UPI0036AB86FC